MAKIGLDIGHGSNTFPPSKGVTRGGKGYAEHDFNSKLGIAIKALLEQHGHTVILGQQPFSRDVPLSTRTNLYNREKVDLVVSLHANANSNAKVNGRCVFYWHTSKNGKKLAEAVVREIKKKGYSTHGNGLHASRIGSWTNLHITRETRMPAVLIEHGFMTGNKDFSLIFGNQQDKYIQDMAEADVRAIQSYLGQPFKQVKRSVPTVAKDGELYRVQVGAFSVVRNAQDLASEIRKKGFQTYVVQVGDLHKVQVGAFAVKKNAERQLKRLKNAGYKDAFITTDVTKAIPALEPLNDPEDFDLVVDGYVGPAVVKALQSYFDLIEDGEMWGQVRNQATLAFNQKAVRYGTGGSPVVRALQKHIGAKVDGYWGIETTRALQRYLGTPVDGEIWRPSTAITELQRRLNNGTF